MYEIREVLRTRNSVVNQRKTVTVLYRERFSRRVRCGEREENPAIIMSDNTFPKLLVAKRKVSNLSSPRIENKRKKKCYQIYI